jgi:hypothetical protein
MFSNGWLNFFYAAHNETASTILNMTFLILLKNPSATF